MVSSIQLMLDRMILTTQLPKLMKIVSLTGVDIWEVNGGWLRCLSNFAGHNLVRLKKKNFSNRNLENHF